MNTVTILWSAVAGACLMTTAMHLLVWLRKVSAWENLFYPLAVLGAVGLAAAELVSMHAQTPAVYVAAIRWAHLGALAATVGALGFVHFYFGTGRLRWLWLALGVRLLAVAVNFTTGENLHVRTIQSIRQIRFLGEPVSVLGEWEPNRWMFLGQLSALLLVVYVTDAAIRLWHRGSADDRRRAVIVGGGLVLFAIAGSGQAGLVAAGVLKMPFLVSFAFLGMVMAMGYELSRDLLRSMNLSRDLDVTEQRLAQAADAAHLALWEWDIGADRIWVSAGGQLIYGVEAGREIDFKRFAATVHPDDRRQVSQAVDAALAGPDPFTADYRVNWPDGTQRWIAASGRVERDGQGRATLLRGVSIDVTERYQAQDDLRQSEDFKKAILDSVAAHIAVLDSHGVIVAVNARWQQFADGNPQRPGEPALGTGIGANYLEACRGNGPGDSASTAREGIQGVLEGRLESFSLEYPCHSPDQQRWFTLSVTPMGNGERSAVVAHVEITERKQAELEASRQQQELAHLSRISILGELAGALAHELNQPLAAILGNSQVGSRMLGKEQPDLPEIADILDDVADDAKRAGGIIHGMRAMFKKDPVSEPQPVDLNEAVTQVLSLLHSEIVSRKIKVELRLEEGLPSAAASRVEIQQVLMNLVLNGLDSMKGVPSGRPLTISTATHGELVEASVHDGGPGIEPEIMDRLFEPFVSTKHGGLGLGLAISRNIAERFHGKLLAENHRDGGAVFRMTLPSLNE